MIKSHTRFLKRVLLGIVFLLVLFTSGWFAFRGAILHSVIHSVQAKMRTKYNAELAIQESSFTGFAGLSLTGVSITPLNNDTLFKADSILIHPSLLALVTGHLRLNNIEMRNGSISLVQQDSASNYANFLKSKADTTVKNTSAADYASSLYKMLKNFFYYLPEEVTIRSLKLKTVLDGKEETAELAFFKHQEHTEGVLHAMQREKTWRADGTISRNDKTFAFKVYSTDSTQAAAPFIETITKTNLSFDTLYLSLDKNNYSHNELRLKGSFKANHLVFHNERLSTENVVLNNLIYDYNITVSEKSVTADSTNVMQVNEIPLHISFNYSNDGHKEYALDIQTDSVPATDFFSSLPPGMFNNFEGMKAEGQLQYTCHFTFNTDLPDSVEFESTLKKDNLRITRYGTTNFSMLNDDFIYTAYEHDRPFRTINVSYSNPDFVPLQNISPYFRNAVMTSEDGSFFWHNGFNEEAFRKSIAENYKAGKFVRGGSTITMQLVKNVFLSRHKTVARKAEEALIVWLIENNNLVSKERMYEVYLNIIELGPDIYGVSEAARFYFNKNASALTLSESIFLASLLPHPKWFKYSFDKSGLLKPYFADYFRVVSNFLLKKNLISQEEYDGVTPEIKLEGPAKNLVMPLDSVSFEIDEEE